MSTDDVGTGEKTFWEFYNLRQPTCVFREEKTMQYLLYGNGTAGKTMKDRMEILRRFQAMYLDRPVRQAHGRKRGKVTDLFPRLESEIKRLAKRFRDPDPFVGYVLWDDRTHHQVTLVHLLFINN